MPSVVPEPAGPRYSKVETALETKELIQAMEDTVAARGQSKEKLVEALQRVVAADRRIEDLELTEVENKALNEKYKNRKDELHKMIED